MRAQIPKQNTKPCLVVEDTDFDRMRIKRVFDRFFPKVVVRFVPTLSDARSELEDTEVSLIFLDNDLPDGKGADFVMELAQSKAAKVPVVMVTDFPSPFMFAKADRARVMDVWTKKDFDEARVGRVLNMVGGLLH